MWELIDPINYQFNPYSLPVFLSGFLVLAIGGFILFHNPRSASHASFFLLCFSVFVWLSGYGIIYLMRDPEMALRWYKRYTFLGVVHIAPSIYFFSVSWLGFLRRQRKFVAMGYLIASMLYVSALVGNHTVSHMHKYFWGNYSKYGPLGVVMVVVFLLYFGASFLNFIRAYRKETSEALRTQIRLIIIAFSVAFAGSVDFLPKLFPLEIYPFGYFPAALWISVVAYSIVNYRLMGIATVIHKTILWFVTSASLLIPLLGLAYFSQRWLIASHPVVIAISVLFVFLLFMFYVTSMQPKIDRLFQRQRHHLGKELVSFNDTLVHLKTLDDLISYIVRTIERTLYADRVRIFLRSKATGDFVDVTNHGASGVSFSSAEPILNWLETNDRLVLRDYLDLDPTLSTLRERGQPFLSQVQAKVYVPLVLNQRLMGLILLGEKKTLKSYKNAEIIYLSELRRGATIALSNSLMLIEMQESLRKWNEALEEKVKQRTAELEQTQTQLVQAEKLATIGTLAGGVAHEINNPLTAILTNAQLLQLSVTNNEDMESLQLIEEGARRCQTIVQKLMKYARKSDQQEVRRELNLNQVIENAVAFIGYQLEQDNILLTKELQSVSKLKGNSNELEQVFTNILLNARDAIKAVRNQGHIMIRTYEENGNVVARIQDDGPGIKQEHLSKIFDPFFTTKDVGKGTGLGLSITYGIVEKHGGRIDVSSKLGEGSVFTVSLPKAAA